MGLGTVAEGERERCSKIPIYHSHNYIKAFTSLTCYRKWTLAVHCSRPNKETRLVKRKVCFILGASNQGSGGGLPPGTVKGQEFL